MERKRESVEVSDFIAEGPPVPIPNTEVKLCSGENTLRETVREDSSMLTQRRGQITSALNSEYTLLFREKVRQKASKKGSEEFKCANHTLTT